MLRLENLSFQYQEGRLLINDWSFVVPEGAFLVLSGAASCGKSTFVNLLHRKISPMSGTISLLERNLEERSASQLAETFSKIGWVCQDQILIPTLSVIDNVLLPLHATGRFTKQSHKDTLSFLDWFELQSHCDQLPDALSASQRQRLCLVRALITKPKLLIADEPFTHIEPEFVARILGLFQALTKQGMAGLILTQKPPIISSPNWQVLKWDEGKLMGSAT